MNQHTIISDVSGVFCIVVQNQTGVGITPNVFQRDGTLQFVGTVFLTFILIAHEGADEELWAISRDRVCVIAARMFVPAPGQQGSHV